MVMTINHPLPQKISDASAYEAAGSLFSRANSAFRNGKYSAAAALYEEALDQSTGVMHRQIFFNLQLARKKQGSAVKLNALKLKKPENVEDFYFELIQEGNFFDQDWYLAQHKDTHQITGNPLAHYLEHGVELSLNPSPDFDTAYYLSKYKDVATSGKHPFLHYVCQGHREGRPAKPFDAHSILDAYEVEEACYVPRLAADAPPVAKAARVIAFYLPQFHPIPENDGWWGKGFTEWTNVKPAKPQFDGHYQPHVPDNLLGYYDLSDTGVMRKQIELAKQYGIEGFCFYTYWFTGHRLLETPVDNYLADPSLDLPFCICWANENWSRRWDGLEKDILIEQHYSSDDDVNFIAHMSKYLRDPRYIRINGRPLLVVYRPNLFPSMKDTAVRWRDWCRNNNLGEIYIAYVQSFENRDPADYGLDAAIEFPPNNTSPPNITHSITPANDDFAAKVYDWRALVENSKGYKRQGYKLFRGVNPSWDNTARRKNKGSILLHSSPCGYQEWLYNAIADTQQRFTEPDERLVFINAWNEWAEGAHLEPDQRYGYAHLEATRMAQVRQLTSAPITTSGLAIVIHAFYIEIFSEIIEKLHEIKNLSFKLFVTTPHAQSAEVEMILQSSSFPYLLLTVNNRGRDVLPFLKIAGKVEQEGYAYILKIHTKKSRHREDGDIWRHDLYNKLLDENSIRMALKRFDSEANLGVLGPSGHIVPMNVYWGSNAPTVVSIGYRLGQVPAKIKRLDFVAGTMFFARMQALRPLFNLAINEEDFEAEAGQIDGTLAHALERIISISCSSQGFELVNSGINDKKSNNTNYAFVQ